MWTNGSMHLLNLLMYVLKYHHEVSIKIKSRSQQISILLSINKWVHINLLVCIFVKRQRILDSTWENFGLLFFIFWELNSDTYTLIYTYLPLLKLYYSYRKCSCHFSMVFLAGQTWFCLNLNKYVSGNNRKMEVLQCNVLLLNHLAGTRTPIASVNKACDYTCIPYFFI